MKSNVSWTFRDESRGNEQKKIHVKTVLLTSRVILFAPEVDLMRRAAELRKIEMRRIWPSSNQISKGSS